MRGRGVRDKGQNNHLEEVEWASGVCIIIKKYDSFYLYYEDNDRSF